MPQHLWESGSAKSRARVCEVCLQFQIRSGPDSNVWIPAVKPICPGDPDDEGSRRARPRHSAPPGAGRVLDEVTA
jgi:hypothetical protein